MADPAPNYNLYAVAPAIYRSTIARLSSSLDNCSTDKVFVDSSSAAPAVLQDVGHCCQQKRRRVQQPAIAFLQPD